MTYENNDEKWEAIIARDSAADGAFVYAVTTTGIYCRPSCHSRRPLRQHVAFYATPAEARTAGFRACKRCQPDDEHDAVRATIHEIQRYIEDHLDADLALETLGGRFGMSPWHLQRTFKRIVGISPLQYATACRREAVRQSVRASETVTDALYDAGYRSSSQFYDGIRQTWGMTPSRYRRGGQDMHITYGTAMTELGRVLVAATDDGVCAVYFGEDDAKLVDALTREYPQADLTPNNEAVQQWIAPIQRYVAGQQHEIDMPVAIPMTPFQADVYTTLRQIPPGETRSYSMIARMIGKPTASRAVAGACARNPVALVIPCHRIVHENGRIDGYRWGTERKQRLLEREQAL